MQISGGNLVVYSKPQLMFNLYDT